MVLTGDHSKFIKIRFVFVLSLFEEVLALFTLAEGSLLHDIRCCVFNMTMPS